MEEVLDANYVVIIDEGKILAQGTSEELRTKYSTDRLKMIGKKGLTSILEKDKIEYYMTNEVININLENSFDGLPLVEKYKSHIKEFEILRGDMDDVFVNITGRKLGDE